jgi:hypothetical protein
MKCTFRWFILFIETFVIYVCVCVCVCVFVCLCMESAPKMCILYNVELHNLAMLMEQQRKFTKISGVNSTLGFDSCH